MDPSTPASDSTPTSTPPVTPGTEAPAPMPTTPAAGMQDPGKTLGIVGLVFAFIGLQLVGLILSIIALSKSKKAGHKNTIAIVGIVLNVVFGIILTGILAAMTIVSYNAITEKAQQAADKAQQQQQVQNSYN